MKRVLFTSIIIIFCSSFNKKEVTWVAIGDSMTYLNDHLNETGNRVHKGYLSRVVDYFDGLVCINKGFNGWTSGGIAHKIDDLGLTRADIYTVLLGTNDWWQGRPVGTINDYKSNDGDSTLYGAFRIIINKIHILNPEAKILLITPPQSADFVYINEYKNNAFGSYKTKNGQSLEQFANAVDSIGLLEQIPVLDLYHDPKLRFNDLVNFKHLKDPQTGKYTDYKYPESTTIPFNPLTDEYPYPIEAVNLTYDGLHPSDKGNAVIANRVKEEFVKFGVPFKVKSQK